LAIIVLGIPAFASSHRIDLGEIDDGAAEMVADHVQRAEQENVDALLVVIDSPGGDVFAGLRIVRSLRGTSLPVVCVVDGMAASMAAVVLEGGCSVRAMTRQSLILFHGVAGSARGKIKDIKSALSIMQAIEESISNLVASRLHMSVKEYMSRIDGLDWWLGSLSAPEVHAVDGVVDDVRVLESVL